MVKMWDWIKAVAWNYPWVFWPGLAALVLLAFVVMGS